MDINKRSKLNFSVILLALFLAVALGLTVYGLYRLGLVQLPALRFEDAMPSGDSEEIEKLIEKNIRKNNERLARRRAEEGTI